GEHGVVVDRDHAAGAGVAEQLAVDAGDAGDQPVGRGRLDQVGETAAAALGGERERAVLGEAARIDERGDVLARRAAAGGVAAGDRGGAGGVETDRVARLD